MGPAQAVRSGLSKYFRISGRASRSEYWWFQAFTAVVSTAAVLADGDVDRRGPFETIAQILLICPTLTVTFRRLHDTNKSAWYYLTPLAGFVAAIAIGAIFGPIIGQTASYIAGLIVILGLGLAIYWLIQKSTPGPNKYGPNPLEVTQ